MAWQDHSLIPSEGFAPFGAEEEQYEASAAAATASDLVKGTRPGVKRQESMEDIIIVAVVTSKDCTNCKSIGRAVGSDSFYACA